MVSVSYALSCDLARHATGLGSLAQRQLLILESSLSDPPSSLFAGYSLSFSPLPLPFSIADGNAFTGNLPATFSKLTALYLL